MWRTRKKKRKKEESLENLATATKHSYTANKGVILAPTIESCDS